MKRVRIFVSAVVSLAFLVIPSALLSYDSSPTPNIVVPECIWAPATGGGTWITQLQITTVDANVLVHAAFYYSGGYRLVANLWTSTAQNSSVKFSNILSTLQSLDSGFTYYGKVGTLQLFTASGVPRIRAQARTVNGNYGKTLPGLALFADGNSAHYGRDMMIQDLVQNAAYRTFVGVFNSASSNLNVHFVIFNANGTPVGSFTKIIPMLPSRFMSFNPFVEAGLGSGTYDNCWLYIMVQTSGSGQGLFCFGSSANNYTNDTSALMAVQYQ